LALALLIAGLGWVLYLRFTDQPLRDPFGLYNPSPVSNQPDTEDDIQRISPLEDGMVRALVPARVIPAYQKISRDDLFDIRRGAFAFVDVDEDFAEENGILLGTGPIIGRVMKRNKRPGFVFTEADFLPKGTRPGLVAGIPPGKRAMRIEVDLVKGIIGLNPGDRFDLIAATTVEPLPKTIRAEAKAPDSSALLGAYKDLVKKPTSNSDKPASSVVAEPRVETIVQGGSVVYPLETRLIPTSSTTLTAGQITGTRPVQEMVIALAPEEVAPLMAALRMKADLSCVARSGHPDDPMDSLTPGMNPKPVKDPSMEASASQAKEPKLSGMMHGLDEVTVIESLVGGKRSLTAVPRAVRSSTQDTSPSDGGE
jgi:Flp pilus assembly protein CpaB